MIVEFVMCGLFKSKTDLRKIKNSSGDNAFIEKEIQRYRELESLRNRELKSERVRG